MSKPIKVLVDNCIDSLRSIMRSAIKEQEIQWGNIKENVQIVGYQRISTLSSDQQWKQRQIECLPTIARLAREELLALYIYNEIRFESWLRSGGLPANILGDLFKDINFINCNAPIERSRIFQMEIGQYIQRDEVIEFCKWLLHSNVESLAEKSNIQQIFPSNEINNLCNVGRFREICNGLTEKQYPDAFHLWTGEVNQLDYFLTADHKFINVMTKTKRINLPCKPTSPEDLLKELCITELDPLPFKEDQFYTIFGMPG